MKGGAQSFLFSAFSLLPKGTQSLLGEMNSEQTKFCSPCTEPGSNMQSLSLASQFHKALRILNSKLTDIILPNKGISLYYFQVIKMSSAIF